MRRKLKKVKNNLLFIPPLIVFFDQLVKYFVVSRNQMATCNPGFAFGLRSQLLNSYTVVLFILICAYLYKRESYKTRRIAYLLIIGGGISNLIDRLVRGCVIDFIDLKVWPSFNLADAAIMVGVGVLITSLIFSKKASDGK